MIGADRIHADDFPDHLKAGYLFTPVLMQNLSLERAAVYGKKRPKFVPATIKVTASGVLVFGVTKLVQKLHFLCIKIDRKA